MSADGQVLVGQDSTLEFGGSVAADVSAMFLPGGDATVAIDDPENFQGVISSENFEPGDAIDLPKAPYIDPGSADLNPDGASFYFETGEQQPNYVLQVVEDEQTYDIPISEDAPLSGGFTLSDDGHGGTLVTYSADAVTGYSDTAIADGPECSAHAGVVQVSVHKGLFGLEEVLGSGFAIGPNLILTAAHVVQGQQHVKVIKVSGKTLEGFVLPNSGNVPNGDLSKSNLAHDYAFVYCPGANFSPSDQFQPAFNFSGGDVNVTGYPQNLLGEIEHVLGAPTTGQFSNFGKVTPDFKVLTYNPGFADYGDSGGPLWIKNGKNFKVVGIVSTDGWAASIDNVPPINVERPLLITPRPFYSDPPSNAARITSAVVVQTGDADTGQTVQFVLNISENVVVTAAGRR